MTAAEPSLRDYWLTQIRAALTREKEDMCSHGVKFDHCHQDHEEPA